MPRRSLAVSLFASLASLVWLACNGPRSQGVPMPTAASTSAPAPVNAVPGTPPPPEVAAMLAEFSPQQLQATLTQLVGFGTRHTLSDTSSETRGIGAARRWIKAEMAGGQ